MKKSILTLSLFFTTLLAFNLSHAQVAVGEENVAKISFDKSTHDYGQIEQHANGECVFVFTNTGTSPLKITNAKGSCGCTVPEWPREPVAPGEIGVIDVKFNSKGKKGKQNKRVTLTTNMVPSQQVLIVKGQVNIKEE